MKTLPKLSEYVKILLLIILFYSCELNKQNNSVITIIEKDTNIKFIIKYNTENVHIIDTDEVLIYAIDSTNIIKKK